MMWVLSISSSKMQPSAKRFLSKTAQLALLFYIGTAFVSLVFDKAIDWRALQDPRERLLWDQRANQAEIIILGDSVFVSAYVNSSSDFLPNVMERVTGKRVASGALNGADSADFLNASRLLVQNGVRETTVVLDIEPVRFLNRRHPEPVAGNYAGQFSSLLGNNLIERGLATLKRPLLILNREVVVNTALRRGWYGVGDHRDRVWNRDGDFAQKRFRRLEKELLDSDILRNFGWIEDIEVTLKGNRNRLVVFLTPVNEALVRDYAAPENAAKYIARFARAREALLQYLLKKGIEHIDGAGQFESDTFADLIHLNAKGDRRVAELVAAYVKVFPEPKAKSKPSESIRK